MLEHHMSDHTESSSILIHFQAAALLQLSLRVILCGSVHVGEVRCLRLASELSRIDASPQALHLILLRSLRTPISAGDGPASA